MGAPAPQTRKLFHKKKKKSTVYIHICPPPPQSIVTDIACQTTPPCVHMAQNMRNISKYFCAILVRLLGVLLPFTSTTSSQPTPIIRHIPRTASPVATPRRNPPPLPLRPHPLPIHRRLHRLCNHFLFPFPSPSPAPQGLCWLVDRRSLPTPEHRRGSPAAGERGRIPKQHERDTKGISIIHQTRDLKRGSALIHM